MHCVLVYCSSHMIPLCVNHKMRILSCGECNKSRRMKWARDVTHLEDLGIDGRTISEHILGKQGGEDVDWMHLAHGKGPEGGPCEHG